jgi:hypothetical protein
MAWKSERKRSITFRKRRLRDSPFGWTLQPLREAGPRVMACMALIMPPPRGSGLDRLPNWIVLLSTQATPGAHQKMFDGIRPRSGGRNSDDDE